MERKGREEGMVLVVASMAMMLLLALGATLILVTSTESMIAANFRTGGEAFYAADAVLERALTDLRDLSDWSQALDGTARSSFADGPPSGVRRLSDGSTIDLSRIVSLANCHRISACTDAEMDATTVERPWGPNNPRWRLYSFGQLEDILGSSETIESPFYLVALVADDPSENDAEPERDGLSTGPPNAGLGVVTVRGEAFGPRGSHRAVEATVERTPFGVRVLSWREVR